MLPYSNLNLSYLERLSTDELVELAVHFGIDIPDGLERVFIIEELLENAPCLTFYQSVKADTGAAPAPAAASAADAAGTPSAEAPEDDGVPPYSAAELPESYNITYIDIIVRDPLWVFVFWEIRDADRRVYERQAGFRGYFLRVNLDSCKMGPAVSSLYTVPVDISDSEWYVNFPHDSPCRRLCGGEGTAVFNVTLCAARTGGTDVLASSVPFTLPRMLPSPALVPQARLPQARVPPTMPTRGARGKRAARETAPPPSTGGAEALLLLSGLDDLPVPRNSERPFLMAPFGMASAREP